ncbi:MAG: hypothetical protein ACEY3M_19040 [Wolbachia sp.]
MPRHWDPEKLTVNRHTIQHFRSKAGSQCLGTGMTRKGTLEFLFQYLYISHAPEQIRRKLVAVTYSFITMIKKLTFISDVF